MSFVVIDLLIEGGAYLRHFQQSWASHFGSTRSFVYGSPAEHPFEWGIFLKNWDLTIPGALGVVMCLERRRQAIWHVLPVAWLALMLIVFATHRPWWSYYYIHIALPLCCCAAIGITQAWEWARQTRSVRWKVVLGVCGVCAVAWMGARVYLQAQDIRSSPQVYSSLVLHEIERLKPFTRYLYADDPVYSFHARIPMPPTLAVMPLKRFLKFNLICLTGIVWSVLLINLQVYGFRLNVFVANFVAIALVSLWNFFMSEGFGWGQG